jgi:hypothetical protein
MPDVTNELMYEVLKGMQARLGQMDGKLDEVIAVLGAHRSHLIGIQQEISGIQATLVRHEQHLGRIEHRLELTDAPTLAP